MRVFGDDQTTSHAVTYYYKRGRLRSTRSTILVISAPNLIKFAHKMFGLANSQTGAAVGIQSMSPHDYLWHYKTGVML